MLQRVKRYSLSLRWPWWLAVLFLIAAGMHFGTAALRMSSFFPTPAAYDFSIVFSAAWAARLDASPYPFSSETIELLRGVEGAIRIAAEHPGSPIMLYLTAPFTLLPYPAAAWLWTILNVLLLGGCTKWLTEIAGYRGWSAFLIAFPVVLTFGPVFLDLTLGQVSIILLSLSLIYVRFSQNDRASFNGLAAVALSLAFWIKLYPLSWLAGLAFLRRWRALTISLLTVLVATGLVLALIPQNILLDWFHVFTRILGDVSPLPIINDQSLPGWLDRIGRSHTVSTPGLDVTAREIVHWSLPWEFSFETMRAIGLVGSALIGITIAGVLFFANRSSGRELPPALRTSIHAGSLFLWILVCLLPFTHMERYNHTLLLPAMAWLWGRGGNGQKAVIIAYLLAGVSRLTHLWIRILPGPWGPFMTGAGLFAVLWLCCWCTREIRVLSRSAALESPLAP